jgi:hypothetical protein
MKEELTEKEHRELREILKDPVRSAELADRAIDAWILQMKGKKPKPSSRSSKKGS